MKHYKKRIIQFTVFGLVGFCMYNFVLRFIEPTTQAETIVHTIGIFASLLLGAVGFFGAAFFALCSLFHEQQSAIEPDDKKEQNGLTMKKIIATEYWNNDSERIAYQKWDDGSWEKREFDDAGRNIYFENSEGRWVKCKFNQDGKMEFYENSDGEFLKNYQDEQGNLIGMSGDKNTWTKFIFNAAGQLIGREDGRGDSTVYRERCEYDENGMRTRIDLSDGHKFI